MQPEKNQTEEILNELKKHTLTDAIIKIKYHVPKGKKDLVDLQALIKACEQAHYVAGIIPIKTISIRERRSDLKVDMNFATLLGAYLDTKPELKERKEKLIKKATELFEKAKQKEL